MTHPQEASPPSQEASPHLSDQVLQLAHDICAAELIIPELEPYTEDEEWYEIAFDDPSIFATPIQLPYMRIERPDDSDFKIVRLELKLLEKNKEDVDTTIVNISADNRPITEDPFIRHVYNAFRESYERHKHERCVPRKDFKRTVQKLPQPIVNPWDKWL